MRTPGELIRHQRDELRRLSEELGIDYTQAVAAHGAVRGVLNRLRGERFHCYDQRCPVAMEEVVRVIRLMASDGATMRGVAEETRGNMAAQTPFKSCWRDTDTSAFQAVAAVVRRELSGHVPQGHLSPAGPAQMQDAPPMAPPLSTGASARLKATALLTYAAVRTHVMRKAPLAM